MYKEKDETRPTAKIVTYFVLVSLARPTSLHAGGVPIGSFPNFFATWASMSRVIEVKSHLGDHPHSARAQESSNELGHERAIDSRTGSTS